MGPEMCILQMWPVDWNSLPKCWFLLFRMESTEKCEAIIQHFNGKFIKIPPGVPGACQRLCFFQSGEADLAAAGAQTLCVAALTAAFSLPCVTPPVPTEPLLCKFADGGQKKRQNQGKYLQNGRPWARDGDTVSESLSKKETPKHELPASHSCRGSKSKTCFESCSVFPSSFTPWLTLFCVFFYLTFVQAAVSVCMISQVLNPVHCFPREEWRLRMTRQPYKMGEWYAQTGWKQPHRAGWKVLVSQASWSDVLPSCGRYRNSNVRKVSCGVCFSVLYLLSQTLVVEWLHINRGGKSIHSLYLHKSTDFSNWKVMIQHLHSCKSIKVTLSWVFLFFLGSLCFFNCSTTKP